MALLNTADAVYIGDTPARRAYLGATKVWTETPVLDTLTAWWTPARVSGGAFVEQRGTGLDMDFGAAGQAPTITDDGTYRIAQFRRADSQYAVAPDDPLLSFGAGAYCVIAVIKPATVDGTLQTILAKRNAITDLAGWDARVRNGTNRFTLGQRHNAITMFVENTNAATTGAIWRTGFRRSASTGSVAVNGVLSSGANASGNVDAAEPVYVGRRTGGDYLDGDLYGWGVVKGSALSAATIDAACLELLAVAAL